MGSRDERLLAAPAMSPSRAKNRSINKAAGKASLGNLSGLLENVIAAVTVTGDVDPAEPLLWGVPAFPVWGVALSKSSPTLQVALVPGEALGHPKAGAGEGISRPVAAGAVMGDVVRHSWWGLE